MRERLMALMAAITIVSTFGFAGDGRAQRYGGTVTLGMVGDIQNPDLHRTTGHATAQLGVLVAESLVNWDEYCNMVPGVAESWKVSADVSEWTFFLRKGVMFHNGRELTAEDVKKSYDRFMDPKVGSLRREYFDPVKRIEVMDRYTVKIYLKEPDAGFLDVLRPINAFITAEEGFEAKPPHPIGTGPFEFVEWKPRQYLTVRRFNNYWKKDKNGNRLPYVDEVILKPIVDDTVRYTALRTGEVDWVWQLPFEQAPELRKKAPAGIVPDIKGGARWFDLAFQLHPSRPTKDVRLRQAVAYALDKKAIMDGLTWGIATPEAQPYFRGSEWHFPIKDPYAKPDLEKSRALLKEAGYEKGIQLVTILRNDTVSMNQATLAQAQLKKVGIDLKLEVMDRTTVTVRAEREVNWDVRATNSSFSPAPEGVYHRYWHTSGAGNRTRYSNPEYDKLIEQASRTPDAAKRKELYRKALEILTRDVPTVFLGHYPVAQASRSHLKNMKTSCVGDIRWSGGGIDHAWIEK